MNRIAPALVAAALLLAPTVAPAQSLGDAAAREKEKKEKEKEKKPSKSYTEEDLRGKLKGTMSNPGSSATPTGGAAVGGATTTGDTSASPAPDAAPATPEEQENLAKNWRARRDYTQSEINRISASITSFEARLADNTAPLYGPGRESLVQNVERAKADLTRAQADLATLEAEGRDKGYR